VLELYFAIIDMLYDVQFYIHYNSPVSNRIFEVEKAASIPEIINSIVSYLHFLIKLKNTCIFGYVYLNKIVINFNFQLNIFF
jgi:hypothetical protein